MFILHHQIVLHYQSFKAPVIVSISQLQRILLQAKNQSQSITEPQQLAISTFPTQVSSPLSFSNVLYSKNCRHQNWIWIATLLQTTILSLVELGTVDSETSTILYQKRLVSVSCIVDWKDVHMFDVWHVILWPVSCTSCSSMNLEDFLSLHQSLIQDEYKCCSLNISICDQICENPACSESARMAQCEFLVAQVKNCQSPVFVIFTRNNLSTNCCRRLRRLNVSY